MADLNPWKVSTAQMLYQTSGQSMWVSAQQAAWAWSTGNALLASWNKNNQNVTSNGTTNLDLLGRFGATGTLTSQGTVGFVAGADIKNGSVDIDCPVKVSFNVPTYIPEDGWFEVTSSLLVDGSASLRTSSPDVSAQLGFQLDMGSMAVGTSVEAFSEKLFDWSLPFPACSTKGPMPLGQVSPNVSLAPLVAVSPSGETIFIAQVKVPLIDTANQTAGATRLVSSGQDYVLSTSCDLRNLITAVLDYCEVTVPPLEMTQSYPGGSSTGAVASDAGSNLGYKVEVGYNLLDAEITAFFGVKQDFSFTPTPNMTLVAVDPSNNNAPLQACADKLGTPLSFPVPVGTTVWYQMLPTPNAVIQITPTLTYDNTFQNDTSLAVWGDFDFTPLSLNAGGEGAGISLPSFDWTPWRWAASLGEAALPVQTCTPVLSGFPASVVGPTFSAVQANVPLAGIASITVNSPYNTTNTATPYNLASNDDGSSGNQASLTVAVTSDGQAWDLSITVFYLDAQDSAHKLQAVTTASGTVVQLDIPSNALTPGVHQIIAVATYSDSKTASSSGTGPSFQRTSSVDLPVCFFTPSIKELHLVGASDMLDSLAAGSPKTTLLIDGLGFGPNAQVGPNGATTPAGSRVFLQGQPLPLHIGSEMTIGQITFDVPASALAAPGSYQLTVVNPAPGGGTSAPYPLTVASATPTLASAQCASGSLLVNGPDTLILLTGASFLPGCTAVVNGQAVKTSLITPTSASAVVPAAILSDTAFGSGQNLSLRVHVANPTVTSKNGVVSGGASADVIMPVGVLQPYVSTLSPAGAVAGSGALQVNITGANLLGALTAVVSSSSGQGQPITCPVSAQDSSHASIQIPASAFHLPGTLQVQIGCAYGGGAMAARAGFKVERPCFYGDSDGTIYSIDAGGGLHWYKDLARNGAQNWAQNSGNVIGSGWGAYLMIIPAGNGVIYAVDASGNLLFFQDQARDGTSSWAASSGAVIDTHWDQFVWAVSDGGGALYAVDGTGALYWYKDQAQNGTTSWARGSRGKIATGWDKYLHVAAGGNGMLYAADPAGNLEWYQDLARNGTVNWNKVSGAVVGQGGWTQFTHLLTGGGGILYPVTGTGDLRFYQDTACNGTQSWAPASSAAIRSDFAYCGPA